MILMTWAPYSARVRPMAGPAMMRQSSRTRIPERIWGLIWGDGNRGDVKGVGGELSSSRVSFQGGVFMRVRP